jgi:hypothetical protein
MNGAFSNLPNLSFVPSQGVRSESWVVSARTCQLPFTVRLVMHQMSIVALNSFTRCGLQ